MSFPHRTRNEPHGEPAPQSPDSNAPVAPGAVPRPAGESPEPSRRVPGSRAGRAWVGISAGTLLAVLLIIFLVQNTGSTEISFLWMTTSTPLAVALLIAAVGSVLLTLIIGTARIAQLRRLIRKPR